MSRHDLGLFETVEDCQTYIYKKQIKKYIIHEKQKVESSNESQPVIFSATMWIVPFPYSYFILLEINKLVIPLWFYL